MSVLLYVVGAIATMVGVGMAGYGIPINEFSFGNTLIVAGTTAAVGGLIVIAIGAAVGKLQRISEMLATRTPARSGRSLDMFEAPAGARAVPMPTRIPFPPRPRPETAAHETQPIPKRNRFPKRRSKSIRKLRRRRPCIIRMCRLPRPGILKSPNTKAFHSRRSSRRRRRPI